MNFFWHALYILGITGTFVRGTEESWCDNTKAVTILEAPLDCCARMCDTLKDSWDVTSNIVWENFHEDLVTDRLSHAEFMDAIVQMGALKLNEKDQDKVTKFVVLTEQGSTGDTAQDVRYLELKLKNIERSEQNIEQYLACCGAFQYDSAVPIYVRSSLMSDVLESQ